jgi:hypothetical protein
MRARYAGATVFVGKKDISRLEIRDLLFDSVIRLFECIGVARRRFKSMYDVLLIWISRRNLLVSTYFKSTIFNKQ